MNIITKKVRLVPQFVGTRIKIKLDDPESLTWGMYYVELDGDYDTAVIDWGDGTREIIRNDPNDVLHTYPHPGEYEVRISDAVGCLRISSTPQSVYYSDYAQKILGFRTNASVLSTISSLCFANATKMATFDCDESKLRFIYGRAFSNCLALPSKMVLHGIDMVSQDAFSNCTSITELHFNEAKKEAITNLPGYADKGAFGAENATVYFDPVTNR